MSDETIETIRTLLEWTLENTDDSEVHYKLRSALQLLEIHDDDISQLTDAAEANDDLEKRLRDLGYLE